MDTKFSLKDQLFNETKITKIADEIHNVYPPLDKVSFLQNTLQKFPQLELKERIIWISENLKQFLPTDYKQAVTVLLKSLPPENDPTKSDNDFGDFIYAPYAEFVAKNGCDEENLAFSLNALKEITTRFSAEDAIRYFINAFPNQTLAELLLWSTDIHYHVRRLASEGTRPKLPWSQKINISPEHAIPILDNLFSDKTRFVTRSVANHINDISKINPELAIKTLTRWKQSEKQNPKEMEYIINHSLRTLIKSGNKEAITFLNISTDPEVEITNFEITEPVIKIGETLTFSFTLIAKKDEELIIDYVLYFPNKKGDGNNKKVFKIKKVSLKNGQKLLITKNHPLREGMTTRTLYPGTHRIEIQINGNKVTEGVFELIRNTVH